VLIVVLLDERAEEAGREADSASSGSEPRRTADGPGAEMTPMARMIAGAMLRSDPRHLVFESYLCTSPSKSSSCVSIEHVARSICAEYSLHRPMASDTLETGFG
jgi:hypothetical protein